MWVWVWVWVWVAGEVVLMFSNEFSWVTNKEIELSYRRRRRTNAPPNPAPLT